MVISIEKLYEFLDSTTFLCNGDMLELLDTMLETGKTKIKWHGRIYDLGINKTEIEEG